MTIHDIEGTRSRVVRRTVPLGSALALAALLSAPAHAVEFETQMQAKFQPTFFGNFDLDSDSKDGPTATSAGSVDVGDEHVRFEGRWGATAKGERWTAKFLLESDAVMDGGQADADAVNVERTYFTYAFDPALVLQAGFEFKAPDFAGGGLLYGDDHPIFGFKGDLGWATYDAYWILVEEGITQGGSPQGSGDSQVYLGSLSVDVPGFGTVQPIVAYHDNEENDVDVTYFGGTAVGSLGPMLNVKGEAFGVLGSFDGNAPGGLADDDVQAFAANLILEAPVNDMFKPNLGLRYTSGDDDPTDDDVEGWLGISDISGFVAPMSSGLGILRWGPQQNAAFATPVVFGTAYENTGPGGATYGGIGNSGTGNNTGQIVVAPGVTGNINPQVSYFASLWAIWYAETGGLESLPGADDDVSSYSGTMIDLKLSYKPIKELTLSAGGSVFLPGQGVEDATGVDDPAGVGIVDMTWSF